MSLEIDLLDRGYFPREVPPAFVSATFAKHVSGTGSAGLYPLIGRNSWTAPTRHNLARPGGLRRPLSIPNPIGYLRIAAEIDRFWVSDLEPLLKSSTLSASRPVLSAGPRAIENVGNPDMELRRATARQSSRIILHADILNFYPTIYTHSIAWAIHTKSVAKAATANRNLSGNRLDEAFRICQEGQTVGIPIGPDASLIIAECILAALEKDLIRQVPNLTGYRWIDDFELCFATEGEAETALATLQELLANFNLTLNPKNKNNWFTGTVRACGNMAAASMGFCYDWAEAGNRHY